MPTGYTPVYKIMKDGADITDTFNDRTISIEVQLKGGNGDSDTCSLTIDDRDWRIEEVVVGIKIEVYLGYKEVGYAQMGVFEVNTVDYEINPRQIKITGNSVGFQGALKAPAIKNFENKSLGDIVKEIGEKGKVGSYISPDLAQEKIPFVNQQSSPLHLLTDLERRFGAVAKFENNRLIFVKRDEGESASGMRTPLLVLLPEHVQRGFVRHTQRGEYDKVKIGWFDPETHVKKYAEEMGKGSVSGGDGSDPTTFLSGKIARTESEAKAMAKSQMAALRRSMGEAHMTLSKGDPWIRDQQQVLIKGFRGGINGSYITDTVTHTYVKDAGILTEILAKPPGTGNDFTSLDEGDFYKLGTSGNFVGEAGPSQPTELIGPSLPEPSENPEPEPAAPTGPINI